MRSYDDGYHQDNQYTKNKKQKVEDQDQTFVSHEIQQYVQELVNHLTQEQTDEDTQNTLINNALEEFIGREAQLCKDPMCSRAIEKMVPLFTAVQLNNFLKSLIKDEEECVRDVTSSACASHVIERMFDRVKVLLSEYPERSLQDLGAFGDLCQYVSGDALVAMASQKYGSHVLRSFIVFLSGIEYPTTRSKSGWNKIFNFSIEKAYKTTKYKHNKYLSEWWDTLAKNLLSIGSQHILELSYDQYGSPVLQTFLQSTIGENYSSSMIAMILGQQGETNGASNKFEMDPSQFQGLAQHNIASHLMEALFISANEKIHTSIYERCLKGQLRNYVLHPYANFVIQALMTCLVTKRTGKDLIDELIDLFEPMLKNNKVGVIAATLNCAFRMNVKCHKAYKCIESILKSKLEMQGIEVDMDNFPFVRYLLEIDRRTFTSANDVPTISKVGCVILATLLKFPEEKCKRLFGSMERLSSKEIMNLSYDYAGVRVLEAFVDSTVNLKSKEKFVKSMKGTFGDLGAMSHCSFFVEKCFKISNIETKGDIISDMLSNQSAVLDTSRGPAIFNYCQVELFKKNKEEWKEKIKRNENIQRSYKEMFKG